MVDNALVLENRRGILSCRRKQEHQTQQSTNSSPRINVNSSPARPIFHPIAQSFQSMPQPAEQGFVTPTAADDSAPQPLSYSKHWESKSSKDPDRPDINPGPKAQEMLQLLIEGSLRQFMPQPTFTSSSNIGSYFSIIVNS
jgi:hypothetical protein